VDGLLSLGERYQKLADYIKKGDRLGVKGEIGTREHEGKVYVTLDVSDVTLLGEKKADGKPRSAPAPAEEFADDTAPF